MWVQNTPSLPFSCLFFSWDEWVGKWLGGSVCGWVFLIGRVGGWLGGRVSWWVGVGFALRSFVLAHWCCS